MKLLALVTISALMVTSPPATCSSTSTIDQSSAQRSTSQQTWIYCGSQCNLSEASSAANQYAANLWIGASFIIYNRHQGWAQAYDVDTRVVGPPECNERAAAAPVRSNCQLVSVAIERSLVGEEVTNWSIIQQVHQATGGTMKAVYEVESSALNLPNGPITGAPNGSALDSANNYLFAAQVRAQAVALHSTQAGSVSNAVNALMELPATIWLGDDISVDFVVIFADGTKQKFRITVDNRDPHGQTLEDANGAPAISSDLPMRNFAGTYYFGTEQGAENFRRAGEFVGASMQGGGETSKWTCTWDPVEIVLTCVPY